MASAGTPATSRRGDLAADGLRLAALATAFEQRDPVIRLDPPAPGLEQVPIEVAQGGARACSRGRRGARPPPGRPSSSRSRARRTARGASASRSA